MLHPLENRKPVSVPAISQHIKRIYADHELEPMATIKKYLTVQTEGERQVSRELDHYNLQMIIAVGFKVNNERAVHEILQDDGKVTHEIAKSFAESEFEKYRIIQDRLFESDFDQFLVLEQEVHKYNDYIKYPSDRQYIIKIR